VRERSERTRTGKRWSGTVEDSLRSSSCSHIFSENDGTAEVRESFLELFIGEHRVVPDTSEASVRLFPQVFARSGSRSEREVERREASDRSNGGAVRAKAREETRRKKSGSGTAEIRTQVRRTPCAEDTATPRSRMCRENGCMIKPFDSRPRGGVSVPIRPAPARVRPRCRCPRWGHRRACPDRRPTRPG